MSLAAKAQKIKAIILDVDGVLTDGQIGFGLPEGEIKFFDVKDGHALKLLRRAGLQVGLLSGRRSAAQIQLAAELELDFCLEGEKDKAAGWLRLLKERGLQPEECLYVGDDLVDLPVLHLAGVGVAVADAVPEVKAAATWTTVAPGGHGAVREVVVWLLQQQGKWAAVTERYVKS